MADGNYITQAELITATKRQQNLWKDDSGTVQTDYLDDDMNDSEAEIDSYLAGRYSTPVTGSQAVALLRGYTVILVRERGFMRQGTGEVPDAITAAADRVRENLILVRDGRNRLPGVAEAPDSNSAIYKTFFEGNTPEYTKSKMKEY